MSGNRRLDLAFYRRDVLDVAPDLLGKKLIRIMPDGQRIETFITETEAYRGEEDQACHARKGKTSRTEMMYMAGGVLYIYLIYGIHWMMNIVTADAGVPQAVLIRGISSFTGPGKLTRQLGIERSFNGESLTISDRIWVENGLIKPEFSTAPRVGIDYADPYWREIPWRFIML